MKSVNLISPYSIAMFSTFVFLVAWFLPPNTYMFYLAEPDWVFLNFPTLLFFGACATGFIGGVWFIMRSSDDIVSRTYDLQATSPLMFILPPLILSTALCGVLLVKSGSSIPSLTGLLSGGASGLKGNSANSAWKHVLPLQSGVLWWAMRRAGQLQVKSFAYKAAYVLAFAVGVLTCVIRLDRTNLMPMIAGVAIISLHSQIIYKNASVKKILTISFGIVGGVITLFLGISFLRGAGRVDLLITGLMGYTVVSYNRLAASVLGILHYSFAGHGLYLFPFLSYSTFLPIHSWVQAATPDIVQSTEFIDVQGAGLVSAFNWCSVFGYIYQDIGWWSPLFLFGVGMLTGWAWGSFRRGGLPGTILYPWFAFNVLYWFGWNYMFEVHIVVFIGLLIFLSVYEELFLTMSLPQPEGLNPFPEFLPIASRWHRP